MPVRIKANTLFLPPPTYLFTFPHPPSSIPFTHLFSPAAGVMGGRGEEEREGGVEGKLMVKSRVGNELKTIYSIYLTIRIIIIFYYYYYYYYFVSLSRSLTFLSFYFSTHANSQSRL
jgi:hypothetical protein